METFIIKLAVAVIPLAVLVVSVTTLTLLTNHHHHPLSWHRTRRNVLRSLANGALQR